MKANSKQPVVVSAKKSTLKDVVKAAHKVVTHAVIETGKAIQSLLYQKLRGTTLFVGNLRKSDFTSQVFETGRLQSAVQAIVTYGAQGVAVSTAKVKMPWADLGNGQMFDISGIKKHAVLNPGKQLLHYAKANGALHTISIKVGPFKGTHEGYIIGKMDVMNVGFVSKDGLKVWTLNTRTLPGKRNADRTFVLEK